MGLSALAIFVNVVMPERCTEAIKSLAACKISSYGDSIAVDCAIHKVLLDGAVRCLVS